MYNKIMKNSIYGRTHTPHPNNCIIDVTFPDNVTVPEIKQKAIEKIKRLNGSLVGIQEVKILRGWN